MDQLSLRERELVAIGAALGSNCIPCIELHIPTARQAGLTDAQISEAIELADKVRQVPARNALAAGRKALENPQSNGASPANAARCADPCRPSSPCC